MFIVKTKTEVVSTQDFTTRPQANAFARHYSKTNGVSVTVVEIAAPSDAAFEQAVAVQPVVEEPVQFGDTLIHKAETVTVVSLEYKEGERHDFTLEAICDKQHVAYGLVDRDYDCATLAFEHADGTECLGTWYDPQF